MADAITTHWEIVTMSTTQKTFKTALALALVSIAAPLAKASPVTVSQGVVITNTSAATVTGSGADNETVLDIHGTLLVQNADVTLKNDSKKFYVDLGSDPLDQGVLETSNAFVKTEQKGIVRIGHNGGGDGARLSIYNNRAGYSVTGTRFSSLELDANARTDAESFQTVSLRNGGILSLANGGIANYNEKPLEISFDKYVAPSVNPIDNRFYPTIDSTGTPFNPASGDIVLRSVWDGGNASFIRLFAVVGNHDSVVYFFKPDTSFNGVVRTEGPGSVWIKIESNGFYGSGLRYTWDLNAAKFVWNHEGDLIIGSNDAVVTNTLKVTADNALPHGAQTGVVVLNSLPGMGFPKLDLAGTTQRINGLRMQGAGGVVTNSAATEAVLVFGTGDADGEISMDITNSAIRCEKVGAGTLTLNGGALNTLSGNAGEIFVKAATYVDTLALTNMAICGDCSLLTVRENLSENLRYVLPDGAASNCVFPPFELLANGIGRIPDVAVKDGPGFVTYMTPMDAGGVNLNVNGGVLRFGGAVCTNRLWRLSLKKANEDGQRYTFTNDNYSVFITVGIGNLNFFTPEGLGANVNTSWGIGNVDVSWYTANASYATPAKILGLANNICIFSKNKPFPWTSADAQRHGASSDPIFRGGGSEANLKFLVGGRNVTNNVYDVNCNDESCAAAGIIQLWSNSVLFTNAVLNPADSSTWEEFTFTLTKTGDNPARTSYAMRRPVNWTSRDRPYVTDWLLESSLDGVEWVTMDERSGQRPWEDGEAGSSGFYAQWNYTYNNHVPYLFKSLNADWRFTTFGKVSVAAGAKLDLSELREENIAFNALEVDCAAGAGTITHFAPAEGGALYLENMSAEQKAASKFKVPITIENWIAPEKLSSWSVYVNGTLSKIRWLEKSGDDIYVHQRKALILEVH